MVLRANFTAAKLDEVNVELVDEESGALRVRVNERGVGWTRLPSACGPVPQPPQPRCPCWAGFGNYCQAAAARYATALRWVLGPIISIATCGVTYAAAGALLSRERVDDTFKHDPPPPAVMGKIKIDTMPPGASVT